MSDEKANAMPPIPMLLWCPECGERHIDVGDFSTKPHHTHACQTCGHAWRPAVIHTTGVQFLPGFKNEPLKSPEYLADVKALEDFVAGDNRSTAQTGAGGERQSPTLTSHSGEVSHE